MAETESDKIDKLFGMVNDLASIVVRSTGAIDLLNALAAVPEDARTNQELQEFRNRVLELLTGANKKLDDLIAKIKDFRELR